MSRPFKDRAFPAARNKYGARRTAGYASKREYEYACHLAALKHTGEVLDWLEQVPIKLPGCRYVVDFLVFYRDGRTEFVEVKGKMTETAQLKLRALEECRPFIRSMLRIVG